MKSTVRRLPMATASNNQRRTIMSDSVESGEFDTLSEADLAAVYGGSIAVTEAQVWGAASMGLGALAAASRAVGAFAPALTPQTAALKVAANVLATVATFGASYAGAKAWETSTKH
jgi:hypothetical protein